MFFIDSKSTISNYFSGIAYSDDSLVLSLDGLLQYIQSEKELLRLQSGRYSLVYRNDEDKSALIMTDPTGQDILYHYQSDNYWAISNSFYRLVEELKNRNIETQVYLPALYAYKIKHSLGGQPLNNNTIIKDVTIIPRDHYIVVQDGKLKVEKRLYDFPEITMIEEYKSELLKVIVNQTKVLKLLIDLLPKKSVRCDLSGGMDSRAVFGMCVKSEETKHKIKFSSNRRLEDDYFIAQKLTQYFGVAIDNSGIGDYKRNLNEAEQFYLYLYGNAGIYNSVYKPSYSFTPKTLHIHGAGGESLRGQYQGSPRQIIGRLKAHFSSKQEYSLVEKEFLSYFLEKGLDVNDPLSMIDHSRNFRARFHFGRNWFRSLTNPLFTPLCDIRLELLSDFIGAKHNDSSIIFYDIYMLLHDFLAFFLFDEPGKNINIQKLKELSVSFKEAAFDEFANHYLVYGKFIEKPVELDSLMVKKVDGTFDELLEDQQDKFMKHYPHLYPDYSSKPHVSTILNALK